MQRPRNPLLCPAGAGWLGHRRRLCGEGSSGRNCCSRVFSAISLFPRPPNLAFQPRLTACTFPPRPLHLSPERHEHRPTERAPLVHHGRLREAAPLSKCLFFSTNLTPQCLILGSPRPSVSEECLVQPYPLLTQVAPTGSPSCPVSPARHRCVPFLVHHLAIRTWATPSAEERTCKAEEKSPLRSYRDKGKRPGSFGV